MQKTFLTILLTISTISFCMAENPSFNLSVLKKGDKAERFVWVRNTTDRPISITAAETGCVCTKVRFDNKEVAPGDSTRVDIVFSAKDPGVFYKTITIKTTDHRCDITATIRGRVDK